VAAGSISMAKRNVTRFELTGGYQIKVWFKNGRSGEVDIGELTGFEGDYYAPLRDPAYFRQVTIDEDFGAIRWPNDADIDPLALYAKATGTPLTVRV